VSATHWTYVLTIVQAIVVSIAVAWASRRVRVNRPVARWQASVISVLLVVNLVIIWMLVAVGE
jgi:sterol desaturase/sphingolipid hydroxylase (fatty acid hydroxylase superfamily)